MLGYEVQSGFHLHSTHVIPFNAAGRVWLTLTLSLTKFDSAAVAEDIG